MKNLCKHFEIIAIFAMIGLPFIACDNGNEIKSHIHEWGDWVQTTVATCTEPAKEKRICIINSSHTETQNVPGSLALGHKIEWEKIISSTYITEGEERGTCSRIGCTFIDGTRKIEQIAIIGTDELITVLDELQENTPNMPYTFVVNVNSITGLRNILDNHLNKFVYLDLSGSTFSNMDYAFWDSANVVYLGCTTLIGITLPNSVTSIGNCAFTSCTNLTSVKIPDSVINIENMAFYNTNLTDINIPNSVTNIDRMAFYSTNLIQIIIPDSVTRIGDHAFTQSYPWGSKLKSVTFSGTIESENFSISAFLGDLREKFYTTNANYGTSGTYTTSNPEYGWDCVWTRKQQ